MKKSAITRAFLLFFILTMVCVTMCGMDTSRENASHLFPREKWTKLCARVFISGTRAAQGMKSNSEHQKLAIEIAQARILAEYGHYVYLVPETGSGKHYDAIVDGITTEFKNVTGGLSTIGKRFSDGIKQGHDVFLKIESVVTVDDIYNKLKGEILFNAYKRGKVYIYLEGKLREWLIYSIR